MFRKRRYAGVLVVALILAVAVAGVAVAATNPQTDPAKANPFQDFLAKFAANLGVDQDKVAAALETTRKQMLDEAVQQGRITREQADKMASGPKGFPGFFGDFRGKPGFPPEGVGPGFPPEGGRGFMPKIDMAGILGMTQEQLKSKLQSGKRMPEIISERGMTVEQFNQKVLEAQKEALAKAVSEGKLTQEQADKMIQRMEQRHNNPSLRKGN